MAFGNSRILEGGDDDLDPADVSATVVGPFVRPKDIAPERLAHLRAGDFFRLEQRLEARSGIDPVRSSTHEMATGVEVVPDGATHQIISGDFVGQYVKISNTGDTVDFVGGLRAGRRMLVDPTSLAKIGQTVPDPSLAGRGANMSRSATRGVPHVGKGKGSASPRATAKK